MMIERVLATLLCLLLLMPRAASATEMPLRILTWEGYVTAEDLSAVNTQLREQGYDIEAQVIEPYAAGAEQMYTLIRKGDVDISFLTLFFIKLQGDRSAKFIQPINTDSPRLGNYRHLLPALTRIPMGMQGDKVLYIPFGGGSYGFYANRKVVRADEVPTSWSDLFAPRWQGKYSLNKSQFWYNVAIASMALGKPPYYLNDLAVSGQRDQVVSETQPDGALAQKLTALYRGAGEFWEAAPGFPDSLQIVSSWGPEITHANQAGGDWQLVQFKEGELVWLDTINLVAELKGRRLEAAEIVANYFIGKEVQSRVAADLSLVAASQLADSNPILQKNPGFFTTGAFVPPYNALADNRMSLMSEAAMRAAQAGGR
ncbi:MAG: extracellular solute-binding protein [Pseudomarimonas sp.]